jgi:hypothetical protein
MAPPLQLLIRESSGISVGSWIGLVTREKEDPEQSLGLKHRASLLSSLPYTILMLSASGHRGVWVLNRSLASPTSHFMRAALCRSQLADGNAHACTRLSGLFVGQWTRRRGAQPQPKTQRPSRRLRRYPKGQAACLERPFLLFLTTQLIPLNMPCKLNPPFTPSPRAARAGPQCPWAKPPPHGGTVSDLQGGRPLERRLPNAHIPPRLRAPPAARPDRESLPFIARSHNPCALLMAGLRPSRLRPGSVLPSVRSWMMSGSQAPPLPKISRGPRCHPREPAPRPRKRTMRTTALHPTLPPATRHPRPLPGVPPPGRLCAREEGRGRGRGRGRGPCRG